jgi:hypothetical protein
MKLKTQLKETIVIILSTLLVGYLVMYLINL